MKREVVLNASNLHVGGGVQAASSLIYSLVDAGETTKRGDIGISVLVSPEVDQTLSEIGFRSCQLKEYKVLDNRGIRGFLRFCGEKISEDAVVVTIFGPDYCLSRNLGRSSIVGFAQPWIAYPNAEAWKRLSILQRWKQRIKFYLQWLFFLSASRLVVELPHVSGALTTVHAYPADRIDVVPNCLSPVFFEPVRWREASAWPGKPSNEVWLGYLTRDYPHKNLEFLVALAGELRKKSSLRYRFFVTLTASEWAARSVGFRATVNNVGPLSLAQCPSFYRAMDGVVFPSLLECFSATPLEAMFMERPLFASDRGFVRDCCADNASYFDPTDPADAAAAIIDWYENTAAEERQARVDAARRHVLAMPDSRDRARRYMEIILRELGLPAPT